MVFITEMVSGGSLKKHLKKIKKPRLKIIKGWCKQILEGLNYLHSNKPNPIIHRDIKCENIFINTNTNQIRIGDLGLAISTKNSYAETLIGTPEFMAPEIFQGKYSTGVDIYAFGMCVLEMATLQTPYQQCTSLPQIYKYIEQRIKPRMLNMIELDCLRKFIQKCLSDAQIRPSAAQLLEDQFLLPDPEGDNKEIRLKEHTVIQEVAPDLQYTLRPEHESHILAHYRQHFSRSEQLNDNRSQQGEDQDQTSQVDQGVVTQHALASSADLDLKENNYNNKNAGETRRGDARQESFANRLTLQHDKNRHGTNKRSSDPPTFTPEMKSRVKANFRLMYKQYSRQYHENQHYALLKYIHSAETEALKQLQAELEAAAENRPNRPKNSKANIAADNPNYPNQAKSLLNGKKNPERPNRIVETLFNDFPIKTDAAMPQSDHLHESGLETRSLFEVTSYNNNPSYLNNSLYTWMEEIRQPDQDVLHSPLSNFQPMKKSHTDQNVKSIVSGYNISHPSQLMYSMFEVEKTGGQFLNRQASFKQSELVPQSEHNKIRRHQSPVPNHVTPLNNLQQHTTPTVVSRGFENDITSFNYQSNITTIDRFSEKNTLIQSRQTDRNKSPDCKGHANVMSSYRNFLHKSSMTHSQVSESKTGNPLNIPFMQYSSQNFNSLTRSNQNTPTTSDVMYTEFKQPSSMIDMTNPNPNPKFPSFGEPNIIVSSDKRPPLPSNLKLDISKARQVNQNNINTSSAGILASNTPALQAKTLDSPCFLSSSRLDQQPTQIRPEQRARQSDNSASSAGTSSLASNPLKGAASYRPSITLQQAAIGVPFSSSGSSEPALNMRTQLDTKGTNQQTKTNTANTTFSPQNSATYGPSATLIQTVNTPESSALNSPVVSTSSSSPIIVTACGSHINNPRSSTSPQQAETQPVYNINNAANTVSQSVKSKSSQSSNELPFVETKKETKYQSQFVRIDQKLVMELMNANDPNNIQSSSIKAIQKTEAPKSESSAPASLTISNKTIDLLDLDTLPVSVTPTPQLPATSNKIIVQSVQTQSSGQVSAQQIQTGISIAQTPKPKLQELNTSLVQSLLTMPSPATPTTVVADQQAQQLLQHKDSTLNSSLQFYKQRKASIKFPISKESVVKEDIMLLQNLLRELTGEKIEAVGMFGHYTEEIVKKYQEEQKIKSPDGIVNEHLYILMIEQLEKKCKLTEKEKRIKEKNEQLERIKKEKNQESQKLLSKMESQILADDS